MKNILFIILLPLSLLFASSLNLTPQEKEYIKTKKEIIVSSEKAYEPFDFIQNNKPSGISIDLLELLLKESGLKIKYVTKSWDQLVRDFENNKIDLLHSLYMTPQREKKYLFSTPYMYSTQTYVYHNSLGEIGSKKDLVGKRVAVAKGWANEEYAKKIPNVQLKYYENTKEMLQAVMLKEADITILNNAIAKYNINKLGLLDLKTSGVVQLQTDEKTPAYHFAAMKHQPHLISIINKALDNLDASNKKALLDKWLGIDSQILTSQEKLYLMENSFNIYINNWEPFSIIEDRSNKNPIISGISVEIFELITKNIPINYTFKVNDSFSDVLSNIQNDPYGITLSTSKTKDKEKYGSFTKVYSSFPIAIQTKDTEPFISSLDNLQDQIIAVGENFSAHKILAKYHPNIKLKLVKNTQEGLDLVSQGKVYGVADIFPVINYISKKYGYNDLKISGVTKNNFDVQILVNKKNEKLITILNKLLSHSENSRDIQKIINNWQHSTVIKETINWTIIFYIIIVISLVIMGLLYRQKLLKAEKQKFKSIFDNNKDGIAITDMESNFVDCNEAYCEMLGYTKKELLTKSCIGLTPKEDLEKVKQIPMLLENNRSIKNFRKRCIKKDNSIIYTDISISMFSDNKRILLSIKDVTQTIKYEKKILEQKKEFESMFDNSKDGIAILDLKSKFLNANKSYLEMLNYSLEDLLQKSCIDLTAPEYKQTSIKALEKGLRDGYLDNYEKVCISKDGKRININMTATLLPDKKRFLVITKNVTALKVIEDQARLASMGEMIGNIAHQWRQPLSIISTASTGILYRLEMGLLDNKILAQQMNSINDNAQYLSKTIDAFRDFIKGDVTFKHISLKEIILDAKNIFSSSLNNHYIELIEDIEDDLIINANKSELEQVIINLINNAKDVLIENNEDDNRFVFITTQKIQDNILELKIFDNGGGIPKHILPKIFDPYFTTKDKSRGTGLGLSIVDQIIRERHQQTITVHNETFQHDGKESLGACFTITFKNRSDS